ncbi:MAG: AraC family transcriptional regulator N-terminal domain-containing protein [Bacteroidota bacterium]
MQEKFIERGTEYQLEHGKLMVYETNCSCRDVKFYFEQNVLTIMRSGHKSILTDSLTFEFFPGTFYIPERECIHTVHIPNATFHNPTACLVLELDPNFLHQFHEEISISEGEGTCLYNGPAEGDNKHFFSNDRAIIENFCRLYDHLLAHCTGKSPPLPKC